MLNKRAPITHYAKAIVAFIVPVLTSLQAALEKSGISGREIFRTVVSGLLTSLIVWAVPNKPPA